MWTYQISTHELTSPDGEVFSDGLYSGAFGPTQNNPAAIAEPDKGPIPPGTWEAVGLLPGDPATGPFSITLRPAVATTQAVIALGRGPFSFLMHGDDIQDPGHGSCGCIVAPWYVRAQFWNSPDHALKVIL